MTGPTQLEHLDPRQLQEHPRNARTDLGDLVGLTASIEAQGVIEPLTVAPTADGGHIVLAGHRRRAAAIAAGRDTVPCVVRDDLMATDDVDLVDQLGTMLSENVHRRNLDAVEEARAVQQLIDLGLTPAKIASKTGLARKHVAKAAGVALLDEDTAAAVAQAGLDLEQAAVVAAYRDDPDVAADLVQAAAEGPSAFTHRVTRAKQDADRRAALLARQTELEAEGRVLADSSSWEGPTNRTIGSLRNADGGLLDAAAHRTCPGSAVRLVDEWNGLRETEVCTDWKANGHTSSVSSTGSARTPAADLPPAERQKQADERRQLIEDNKAMQAANTTRREWIRTVLLARRRADKTVLRFAVEALGSWPSLLSTWLSSYQPGYVDDGARAELGLQPPWRHQAETTLTSGENVVDARLPLQLLAHVAAAIEQQLGKVSHRKGDHRRDQLVAWLTFLEGEGYGLSEIEQRIVDAAARRSTS